MELEDIHLFVLALTALVILYSDHQGFDYFRGKKQTLSHSLVHHSHRLVWTGLVVMIATGVGLVLPSWQYYLSEPVFYVKMGLVGVLVVNAIAIGKLSRVATERPFALLSSDEKRVLMLSGTLSAIGWVGAAFIGMFVL